MRHVGRLGAGATVKLAANAANMSTMVCLGEVLALTDRDGLEPEVVLDALGLGPLGSFVDRFRDKVLGRVESVDFRLALARKDLALALDEGEADGLNAHDPEVRDGQVRRGDRSRTCGPGQHVGDPGHPLACGARVMAVGRERSRNVDLVTRSASTELARRFLPVVVGARVGDAMGAPAEGLSSEDISARFGWIDSFTGDGTDDSLMATLLADALGRERRPRGCG